MFPKIISKIICSIIALTILVFSLIPITQPVGVRLSDKIIHGIAYSLLGYFFILAFKTTNTNLILLSIISIIACTFYGSIIELLQSFTNRSTEIPDIIADFIGSTAGTLIAVGILFIKKKIRP